MILLAFIIGIVGGFLLGAWLMHRILEQDLADAAKKNGRECIDGVYYRLVPEPPYDPLG